MNPERDAPARAPSADDLWRQLLRALGMRDAEFIEQTRGELLEVGVDPGPVVPGEVDVRGVLFPTAGTPRVVDVTAGEAAVAVFVGATIEWFDAPLLRVPVPPSVGGCRFACADAGILNGLPWNPFFERIPGPVVAVGARFGKKSGDLSDGEVAALLGLPPRTGRP